jgi:hypothetical protein
METYFGIMLIILPTAGSVHYVFKNAYRLGKEAGINEGRMQILQENLNRLDKIDNKNIEIIIDDLVKETPKIEKVRE